MRFALGIEYDGSGFHGWQSQPCKETVQDALECAITKIAGSDTSVICAGRTDAGVHALGQVAHFDTPALRPLEAWVRGVNANLPSTVTVRWAHPVTNEFHARFSAKGRHYRYILINRPERPGLWHGRMGWFHHLLDLDAMRQACAMLLGEHDFSAFRAAGCQAKSPVKILQRADVRRAGELVVFDFEANAFLHHMVRNLVGSLVYIGQGLHSPEWMTQLLNSKDRKLAAPTFSAAGLYLMKVFYENCWSLPDVIDSFLPD